MNQIILSCPYKKKIASLLSILSSSLYTEVQYMLCSLLSHLFSWWTFIFYPLLIYCLSPKMFLLPVSLPLTSILIATCLAVLQSRKAATKLSGSGSLGLSEATLALKHNLQTRASYTAFLTAGLWERTNEAKNRPVTAYQEAYRERENMLCCAQQ